MEAVPRVLALHKPRGVLVSRAPEAGATTVFELVGAPFDRWWCAGRLDKDSEGLLLLCDDPRWAHRLAAPGGLPKTYVATVRGRPSEADLEPMRRGGELLDGRPLRPVEVRLLTAGPRGRTRFEVVLREGLHRQVRRQFLATRHTVQRLERVAIGPLRLGDLPPGAHRELGRDEVTALLVELARERP